MRFIAFIVPVILLQLGCASFHVRGPDRPTGEHFREERKYLENTVNVDIDDQDKGWGDGVDRYYNRGRGVIGPKFVSMTVTLPGCVTKVPFYKTYRNLFFMFLFTLGEIQTCKASVHVTNHLTGFSKVYENEWDYYYFSGLMGMGVNQFGSAEETKKVRQTETVMGQYFQDQKIVPPPTYKYIFFPFITGPP